MSDQRLDPILEHVLEVEGWPRYTNRPNDRGGPTKGGITLATYSRWLGREATIAELQAMPRIDAELIYTRLFIAPFERIRDALLRLQVVDAGVMSGTGRVTEWLQELVGVEVDGRLGTITASAINAADPHVLGVRFGAYRIRYLGRLITKDRKRDQRENAHGWMNRCTAFLDREAARG